jgi:hypothetical protein
MIAIQENRRLIILDVTKKMLGKKISKCREMSIAIEEKLIKNRRWEINLEIILETTIIIMWFISLMKTQCLFKIYETYFKWSNTMNPWEMKLYYSYNKAYFDE